MSERPAAPQYVLGRSETESQRLVQQSGFMRPSTERVFHKAGVATGMRVLDLGCGVGDVSFLAAEIVGPTGSVVGIDLDPGVLALARRRARKAGSRESRSSKGPSTVSRQRFRSMPRLAGSSSCTRPTPSRRSRTWPAS